MLLFLDQKEHIQKSALLKQFGSSVQKNPEATIQSVFESVESNQSDFGIVPIENSTEGAVNVTLDCLANLRFKNLWGSRAENST